MLTYLKDKLYHWWHYPRSHLNTATTKTSGVQYDHLRHPAAVHVAYLEKNSYFPIFDNKCANLYMSQTETQRRGESVLLLIQHLTVHAYRYYHWSVKEVPVSSVLKRMYLPRISVRGDCSVGFSIDKLEIGLDVGGDKFLLTHTASNGHIRIDVFKANKDTTSDLEEK